MSLSLLPPPVVASGSASTTSSPPSTSMPTTPRRRHVDAQGLKTSRHGIVLQPQPSDDPNDPLNWPATRKYLAAGTISWLAFVCYAAVSGLVPGTEALAASLGVSQQKAVYLGSMPIALYAVGPLLWSPLSHFTGRRPVMLLCNVVAIVGALVAATATTFAQCMAGRVVLGLGGCIFWALGPASIGDIFFRHEKGKMIGISTLAIVLAPYAGAVIGGAIINNKSLGWQWSQWLFLIFMSVGLVAQIFLVPETIYVRKSSSTSTDAEAVEVESGAEEKKGRARTFWARYGFFHAHQHQHQHSFFYLFTRPLALLGYWAVLLPSLWFGLAYTAHVAMTAEIPLLFAGAPFHFSTLEVGLTGLSGLVGALLGEAVAGPSVDHVVKRCARDGREWRPEMRLAVIWPALVAVPAGVVLFGLTVQFPRAGWVPPMAGQALYVFGVEIATTVIQTYILEAYPRQGAEVTLVFNLFRNGLAYTTPFFVGVLIRRAGAAAAFGLFAVLAVVFFPFTIAVLMWRGKEIRERGGDPGWSRD